MEKSYKKYGAKARPRPLLILVQNPKQPLQAKYPVKTDILSTDYQRALRK